MTRDVLLIDAQGRSERFLDRLRILRRRPHFHFAVPEIRNRCRRLHRGVREHRRGVRRFEHLPALREFRIDVAGIAHNLRRMIHRIDELLPEGF